MARPSLLARTLGPQWVYVPKTRGFFNTEAGVYVSRRQYDRMYGALKKQGYLSYEERVKAQREHTREHVLFPTLAAAFTFIKRVARRKDGAQEGWHTWLSAGGMIVRGYESQLPGATDTAWKTLLGFARAKVMARQHLQAETEAKRIFTAIARYSVRTKWF